MYTFTLIHIHTHTSNVRVLLRAGLGYLRWLDASTLLRTAADPQIVHVAVWLVAILGAISLLACRYHYTIDVLIAFSLTLLTWGYYHSKVGRAVFIL